jgi:hypothetical protein
MSKETMTIETTKQSHSEQQAWAQLSGICEMVAKLTREGAAKVYAETLSLSECAERIRDTDFDASEFNDASENEQLALMREKVAELISDETIDPDDFKYDEDSAREAIQEDPLSVQVRSDWYSPGDEEGQKPSEFEILLCTGGPAVRIRGELDAHLQPHRAWIEHQDWGTPWTQIFGLDSCQQEALMTYCGQFYFGE